ncbi:YlqD family protein [Neobacillus sp. YIM B06451]|uniref:YlqD family protein n=1 Tax=Neobacillus sp. YIM B06451 TaxID=3070994 RepID=UPI00292F131F|nr:YlqD family protein [Neobacillus sp. YIM B06451]
MKILRTVAVKQVLTETSRRKLLDAYLHMKAQLEKECGQLKFEQKKLEKAGKLPPTEIKRHFEKEILSRKERMEQLEFQIGQLHMLPLGSELKESEVQAIIDIKPGDPWEDSQEEIIIRDGIIEEIRKR